VNCPTINIPKCESLLNKRKLLFVVLSGNGLFWSYKGKNLVVILEKHINYSGIQTPMIGKLLENLNCIVAHAFFCFPPGH
jgi:hypothetical protein